MIATVAVIRRMDDLASTLDQLPDNEGFMGLLRLDDDLDEPDEAIAVEL